MAATTTAKQNKRTARRFPEEVANHGAIELIDEICTEDVLDHSPLGDERGRDALKQQGHYLRGAFSDLSVTVEDAVADEDTVALRVTFEGIHNGEFMGIDPTGHDVSIQNMVFFRMTDGKIAERWVQPDMLSLMHQLGVVELPGK